eukprot:2305264-Lingulodinium_polyedra.AAC.1
MAGGGLGLAAARPTQGQPMAEGWTYPWAVAGGPDIDAFRGFWWLAGSARSGFWPRLARWMVEGPTLYGTWWCGP